MEFRTDKPIYKQIIDYAFGRILEEEWLPGCKVPSVRELSVALAVNSHTILKAYDHLQDFGIIIPRRGMGFFLADDARERIEADRRREFFQETLCDVFEQMIRLGISIHDVEQAYNNWQLKNQQVES